MTIDTNAVVSMTEANRNFSKVTRLAEQKGQAVIFKNNRPKYMLIDLDASPIVDMTDDEKIDFEFIWWVLHEGRDRSHREALRAIRDRWPDMTVIIRNQRQLDAFYRSMA